MWPFIFTMNISSENWFCKKEIATSCWTWSVTLSSACMSIWWRTSLSGVHDNGCPTHSMTADSSQPTIEPERMTKPMTRSMIRIRTFERRSRSWRELFGSRKSQHNLWVTVNKHWCSEGTLRTEEHYSERKIRCGCRAEPDPETSIILAFCKVEFKSTWLLKRHVLRRDSRRYEWKLSRTHMIVYMIYKCVYYLYLNVYYSALSDFKLQYCSDALFCYKDI